MRHLFIALTFCFLLAAPQAHACLWNGMWKKIFFETIPNPQPNADVIAKVSLSDVDGDGDYSERVTATIMQVLKTSDARVYQGAKIVMLV
ncbi:MAG: hypothetical protein LBQ75_02420, partial [Zoogloeaceae bacterium]|nr:hypothetical protein [Zoogloeaceae bacterium]